MAFESWHKPQYWGTAARSLLAQPAAEHLVDRADDDPGLFAPEAVIDGLALAPGGDEALGAQPRELLRHGRLAQRQQALELAHGFFALGQNAEDHQPALVGERLEELGRLARLRDHGVELVGV